MLFPFTKPNYVRRYCLLNQLRLSSTSLSFSTTLFMAPLILMYEKELSEIELLYWTLCCSGGEPGRRAAAFYLGLRVSGDAGAWERGTSPPPRHFKGNIV